MWEAAEKSAASFLSNFCWKILEIFQIFPNFLKFLYDFLRNSAVFWKNWRCHGEKFGKIWKFLEKAAKKSWKIPGNCPFSLENFGNFSQNLTAVNIYILKKFDKILNLRPGTFYYLLLSFTTFPLHIGTKIPCGHVPHLPRKKLQSDTYIFICIRSNVQGAGARGWVRLGRGSWGAGQSGWVNRLESWEFFWKMYAVGTCAWWGQGRGSRMWGAGWEKLGKEIKKKGKQSLT